MKNKIIPAVIAVLCVVLAAAIILFPKTNDSKGKKESKPALITEEIENFVLNKDITPPYGVSVINTSDDGIKIYWKEPENVQGYVIYRSYRPDCDYKVLDTVGNTPYFSTYVDNTFDSSVKKVYYRVRAIRETKDGKTFSELSERMKASYKKKIVIPKSSIFMFSGDVRKVNAYYGWTNAHDVEWTSDDESVATVNQSGEITGVGKGETFIRCTSDKLSLSDEVKITVDREDEKPLSENVKQRYVKDGDGI